MPLRLGIGGGVGSCFYILKERKVVQVDDVYEWGSWFERIENRRVGETEILFPDGRFHRRVSTVFIGLMSVHDTLFETMCFDRTRQCLNEFHWATFDEAEKGHAGVVNKFTKNGYTSKDLNSHGLSS